MAGLVLALWRKVLGSPFVYEQIRPRVVGGIDLRPVYELLAEETGAGRAILDVGCGTGDALRYLEGFDAYLGVDTDPIAIAAAKRRWGGRANVRFEARPLEARDVEELAPTAVVLSGVLHHLSNEDAVSVLRLAAGSPRLRRVVTNDILFVPEKLFNNVMAMLDRGRHCRVPDAYADLARGAGLSVERSMTIGASPNNTRVSYFVMALAPR